MNFSTRVSVQFAVLFLTGFLAIGYLGYSSTIGMLETRIRRQLEYNAFHSMDKIDRLFFERQADIADLRSDSILRSGRFTPKQITTRLNQFPGSHRIYTSLSLFDMDRRRIADTAGKDIGRQHPLTGYWREIAAGRDLVVNIARSATTKQAVIHILAVIKDGQGRRFRVVASRIPVDSIYEIVGQIL